MKPAVFILTYTDAEYLANWLDLSKYADVDLYILNNGTQSIPDKLKSKVVYNTKRNIFCAGGWNLICKIAFNYYNYDKIIVTQDDLMFNQQQVIDTLSNTTPNNLVGGTCDMFYYSFFGIHKNTYKTVGDFDESFIEVTCEDNDYHYRCILNNIVHKSMNYSMSNRHFSTNKLSWKFGNKEYLIEKWGPEINWGQFTYTIPFNGTKPCFTINRPEYFERMDWSIYGFDKSLSKHINSSDIEYSIFLNKQKWKIEKHEHFTDWGK